MSGSVILLLSVFSFPQAVLTSPNDCGDYIHIESEVRGLKVTGCMLVFVGKNEAEQQTGSTDRAGLVRNVTDSVGRRGMNSSAWLSHPPTASSFTQYTIEEDKVNFSQVVSCSQENTGHQLPMSSHFTTVYLGIPGLAGAR